MAEEEYVTYDKYRADLADFRADFARFREEVMTEIRAMRTDNMALRAEVHKAISDQTKWLAGLVILAAGLALAIAKLI